MLGRFKPVAKLYRFDIGLSPAVGCYCYARRQVNFKKQPIQFIT